MVIFSETQTHKEAKKTIYNWVCTLKWRVFEAMPLSSEKTFGAKLPGKRRRKINPRAGRAIEMLGHAIDYLVDMDAHEGSLIVWEKGHLEAVEILKALNRQIYLECPVVPSFGERWSSYLFGKR